MTRSQTAPFGSWKSPVTSELIVSEAIKLGQLCVDGHDIYWVEGRPTEEGRNVIIRRSQNNDTNDLTPKPFNVRTRVHEYGGGAYRVSQGTAYFSNYSDQRIYRQSQKEHEPQPITAGGPYRYADYVFDQHRNRLVGIREDHSVPEREPTNAIVTISLDTNSQIAYGQILVQGNDFYASPRLSPNGQQLAWLTWNHPNMPWDGTELWLADIQTDGSLCQPRCIAGGEEESIFQPEWSPTGILHFISDRTGWWNLYRIEDDQPKNLNPMEAEFGEPQWVLGLSTYTFESPDHLICTYTQKGQWYLGRLDVEAKTFTLFNLPYTEFDSIHVATNHVYCTASSPTEPNSIVQINLTSHEITVIRDSLNSPITQEYLSIPMPIEYPTDEGKHAHAFFYPPHNADYAAPLNERPPLIVKSHGGPTGSCGQAFNLMIQYWTSRGFGVVDVNYGGSTGYGREYRERLNGQWGVVDVADCVNAVSFLIHRGEVDPKRVAITGGSAGGYTTLCALTFHDIFTGGSSYYGVSDLEALVHDTHKFESRYLDRLVGPYPEKQERYHQRSPIHFVERLSCPVILFQGLEDKVVPPNQAEKMVQALREKNLPVAYVAFEGEQHGFRKAKNIKRVLDAELYFYSRIFSFTPAHIVEPVQIINLAEA